MEKYFMEEVEKTVESINRLADENCMVFSLLADIHIHPEQPEKMLHFKHTLENIKAVHERCNIDALFYLGDIAFVNSVMKGSYWTEEIVDRELMSLKNNFYECNENSFFVAGNHDGVNACSANPKNWYDKMIDTTKVNAVENEGYFYVDFPNKKVRAVCLMDSCKEEFTGTNFLGYYPKQLQWLADTALNIPEGYKVIVFCHIMLETKRNIDRLTNSNDLAGIFNAFCEKGKYESENVSADFTHRNEGEIVALFGGHGHVRWAGRVGDIPFLQIQTPSNLMHMPQYEESWCANLPEDWESVEREMHTLSEDLWDTVIYNTKENKMYVIRFGAGEDAEYSLS